MRILPIILIIFMLQGCAVPYANIKNLNNYHGIGDHPYQCVGYYEETEGGFVSRIIIHTHWIKKMRKDKHRLELTLKNTAGTQEEWEASEWTALRRKYKEASE